MNKATFEVNGDARRAKRVMNCSMNVAKKMLADGRLEESMFRIVSRTMRRRKTIRQLVRAA